ncbi:MAG: hypothetical protein ACREF8_03440 [Chthoniobacterales bacterium]
MVGWRIGWIVCDKKAPTQILPYVGNARYFHMPLVFWDPLSAADLRKVRFVSVSKNEKAHR